MAATTSAVFVLLDGAIFSANVFILRIEVIGMAAGTGWCVSFLIRVIVRIDTGSYRSFVTASTARIPSMVAWIVTLSAVLEVGWRPAISGMTHVTLFRHIEMTDGFGRGAAATDMTAITVICSAGIMHPCAACEGGSGMT